MQCYISIIGALSSAYYLTKELCPYNSHEVIPHPTTSEIDTIIPQLFQETLKCPTNEISCNRDNSESLFNYLCRPGHHTIKSVVVGTRADELLAVKAKMKSEQVLKKFEDALYRRENTRLIPNECKWIADDFSEQVFSKYLDKYRHCGLNERNAVSREGYQSGLAQIILDGGIFHETWRIETSVRADGFSKEFPDEYIPPAIAAYHELMHVEEIPRLSQKTGRVAGDELLTSLTTLMQLDEAFKKCKRLDLSKEVDYHKLKIDDIKIPLGRVANCFRSLTKKFNNQLFKALISPQSVNFLKTGICKLSD